MHRSIPFIFPYVFLLPLKKKSRSAAGKGATPFSCRCSGHPGPWSVPLSHHENSSWE